MTETATQAPQSELDPSANPTGEPRRDLPQFYALELWFEDANGFVCRVTASEASRAVPWVKSMVDGLKRLGMKPHNPHPAAVIGSAPGGGGVASGGPTPDVIAPTAVGDPPKCATHGAMKYVNAGTNRNTNKPYSAFWACNDRTCKATYRPTAAA